MQLRVEILGAVRLFVEGHEVPIKRKQVERALVLLAARCPHPVPNGQLVEHLWGASLPADPKASLRVALSRLRTTLGAASAELTSASGGYRIAASTDVGDFEGALALAANAEEDELALPHWRHADGLWTDSLAAFAGEPLLEPTEGRLRRLRQQSIPAYAECLHRLGSHEDALRVASPAHQANIGDERLAIVCAEALAATGRKAMAVQLLETTRVLLRDQLGLSPSKQMAETEDRIIREGASLGSVDFGTLTPPPSRTFVGRAAEVDWLLNAAPGLHTVSGSPGSGKTALVSQVAKKLEQRGQTVLWARALQTPLRPMEALTDLVTQIADATPGNRRSEALRSVLSRLAPDCVEGFASQPASRDGLLALSRQAIDDFAEGCSQLVIIVDDAQWLDRSSAHVVDALIDDSNVILIATARESLPPHLAFILDQNRRTRLLSLTAMTRADVETFVATELPALPLDTTTERLFRQSGGNALFVTLLADLTAEGALSDSSLPPSVLVIVQKRLASLSGSTRRTLEIASIFGDSIPVGVLSHFVPEAERDIAEAILHGLLVTTEKEDRYRFAHALVAEAAYQLLADGSRLELHDEVGRRLEEAGAPAAEYALHSGEAAAVDPIRAVRSHLCAANEFTASFDWDTALLHAQRGLRFQKEYELQESEIQAKLLVVEGSALRAHSNPSGDASLISGVDIALSFQKTGTVLSGLLALCTYGRMRSPEGAVIHDQLKQAMSLELTTEQHAQLLACEATLLAISPLQDQGRRSHVRAFEMLSDISDVAPRRQVLIRTHLGFPHPDDLGHRVAATEMLRQISGNDPDLLWEVAFLSFGSAMVYNQPDAAEQSLTSMRELTPKIRVRQRDYGLRFCEAAWARFNKDLDEAESLLGEAVQIGQESFGDGWAMIVHAAVLSAIREAQGRLHEMLPLVDELLRADPAWPTWHVVAAAASASHGDVERARREIDWLKRDDFACMSPDISWAGMLSFLTAPVALLDDVDVATTLLKLVEPYAGLNLWNGACIHRPADEVIEIYRALSVRRDCSPDA